MPLGFLQYGLLVVPAVLFSLTLPLQGEALYTFYILISTLLAVANRFTRSGAQQSLLFLAEILWASWLIALYGPFMIFISIGSLCLYVSARWIYKMVHVGDSADYNKSRTVLACCNSTYAQS